LEISRGFVEHVGEDSVLAIRIEKARARDCCVIKLGATQIRASELRIWQ